MKVETYKETYRSPVVQIPVPAEFQMGNFDVIFMKKTEEILDKPKAKRKPHPLLKGVGKINGDIMSPTTDIEDWELD